MLIHVSEISTIFLFVFSFTISIFGGWVGSVPPALPFLVFIQCFLHSIFLFFVSFPSGWWWGSDGGTACHEGIHSARFCRHPTWAQTGVALVILWVCCFTLRRLDVVPQHSFSFLCFIFPDSDVCYLCAGALFCLMYPSYLSALYLPNVILLDAFDLEWRRWAIVSFSFSLFFIFAFWLLYFCVVRRGPGLGHLNPPFR